MHASQNSESVSVLTWSIAVYTCVSKWRLTTFSHSNKFWISFSSFPARIFTTLDRGFDAPLLANYSVSLILNLAIITLALKLRRPVKKDKKTEWKWNWRRVACPQKQSRDASVLCVYFFVQLLCQQRIHFSKRAAIYMWVYTVSLYTTVTFSSSLHTSVVFHEFNFFRILPVVRSIPFSWLM